PPFSAGSDSIQVVVNVPFTGEAEMFKCTGGCAPVITEEIQVQLGRLVIPMRLERSRAGELDNKVDAILKRVREGLGPIQQELGYFNPDLKRWAAQRIQERQADLARHSRTLGELQKSRFRILRRGEGAENVVAPVKPKAIIIPPRPSPASPEPELSLV